MHRIALVLLSCLALVPAAASPGRAASGWPQPWDAKPQWSPDGRTIAFTRTWSGQYETVSQQLVLRDVTTGTQNDVFEFSPGFGGTFDWSPDSSLLAIGNLARLYALDVTSGSVALLATPQPGRSCCIESIRWSPEGSRIAFSGPDGDYLTGLSPDSARRLSSERTSGFSWSPDGSELAVGVGSSIARLHPDSGQLQPLADLPGSVREVEWGRAGWFAFVLADGRLGLVSPVGAVSIIGSGSDPTWAPEGTRLAWSYDRAIRIYDVEDQSTRRVGAPDPWDQASSPTWSPDGQQIAYVGAGHCAPGIIVARADGSRPRRLTHACKEFGNPRIRSARLRITVWPRGPRKERTHWTLRCGPVGGTLPSPAAACARLLGYADPWLRLTPPCWLDEPTGSQFARVVGRFRGRRVWTIFRRDSVCDAARWSQVKELFPGTRKS
jgi:dipeptidyl aminopeptidase/acylaminoacyl peptidase